MRKQHGVSLSGLLITAFLLVVVSMLGIKLAPSYIEYYSIKKALTEVVNNPEVKSGNPREVQLAFSRYQMVEGIKAIEPADVMVTKEGEKVSLSASWTVKLPLFHNISIVIDFEATSGK